MKKSLSKIIALVMAVVLSLSTVSNAVQIQPHSTNWRPELSFNGTTATCFVNIYSPGDEISATLTLRYGGTRCATWYAKGTSSVTINETKEVTPGYTYTLTLSGTINGEPFEMSSTTAVCN